MKKFSKILILVLSLVIAMSAFAIASSANTSPFLVEGLYRENWEEAIENAYNEVKKGSFDNAFYRKDIGKRALEKTED